MISEQAAYLLSPAVAVAHDGEVVDFIRRCCGFDRVESNRWQTRVDRKGHRPDVALDLWQVMDIKDFSSARFFLAPLSELVILFEVDFFSRHEMAPRLAGALPNGWERWGVVRGNCMLVSDKKEFMKSILTADAFIAIPPYRFEQLADDIECAGQENNENAAFAACRVLTRPNLGYSFRMYVGHKDGKTTESIVEHSILTEANDASLDLCRSALEQHNLREDRC